MPTAASRPQRSDAVVLGGRFEIEREVGRGGVGVVYRAFDRTTEQWVALKRIATQGVDPSEEARFGREGKVLNSLQHPHVVKLVAWGTFDDASPYVAMEWLEGEDLAARTHRAPLGLRDALEVTRQIATALEAAHGAGMIHRDIKPSNIFLLGGDKLYAKLVDFGLALEEDIRLTRTGVVLGTPAYMAPEQARADGVPDARVDIYSLGASLFELIAGRPPHVGPTAIATLARLVTTRAARLSEVAGDVPPALDDLVTSLLATDAADRPRSAASVARALEEIISDLSPSQISRQRVTPPSGPSGEASIGTRLVTSIVAVGMGSGETRTRILDEIHGRGADAVALGHDAIVAHLGARRSLGGEAVRALELGRFLAEKGGQVGVATGRSQVELTRPVGEVVDRAAGLAHGAEPAQVLADTTTTELARGRFQFQVRPDGAASVGEPLAKKRAEGAGGAPLLGREAELAQIMSAFERCIEDETPVLISVSGAPGIGKSRLGREAVARLAAQSSPPKLVVVRCEPFGRGHLLGVAAALLRGLVGIGRGSNVEAIRAALSARAASDGAVAPLGARASELLARLVANEALPEGIEARGARDELWLALTDFVGTAVKKEPSLFVLEDLQWADHESVSWLDHLLGRSLGRPLCVLSLVRPEFFRDAGPAPRFVGRDHVRIELRPISRRAARGIAKTILGPDASDDVLDRIAARAGGSPLFAEELSRLTALGQSADRAPTIEAAIQVILDALDENCRDAVARLSVFGLSGWDQGLLALGVDAVPSALRQLAAAELIVEQAESRLTGAREWAFKHALVRDVAYASLGEPQKRSLHPLAAGWLAQMGEDAATVAEHFELGGKPREAAVYWERAARRALATNALVEAVRMADAALSHAEDTATTFARAQLLDEAHSRLDPRAADRETAICAMEEAVFDEASSLRAKGARARYDHARGFGSDIAARLAEVSQRAASMGLVDEEARSTATLATRHAFGGDLAAAEDEARHLLDLAERSAIASAAVDAWQTLAVVRQTRGELASALTARRNAARAASHASLKEREGMLTVNLGFALTTIGARQEAREALEAGLAIAHAIGSPGALRHARMNLLGWTATFGPHPGFDAELAEPRADADGTASGSWVVPDRATLGLLFYRGCELLSLSDPRSVTKARSLLKTTTEAYRATGNHDVLPVALGLWAQAERSSGDSARACDLAREAATLIEQGAPSLLNEAPVFLALHDACIDLGDAEGAKDAIGRGIGPLSRRLLGLSGTTYAKNFLTDLPQNAALLANAEQYGLVPADIAEIFGRGAG